MADGLGIRPGQVVKQIVQREMAGAPLGRKVGSAAPKERESSAAPAPGTGRAAVKAGLASAGAALGSGGDLGTGPAAAPSRSADGGRGRGEAVADQIARDAERAAMFGRPAGSAGSGPAVPPAAGSAAPVSSPAGAETAGVPLLAAVSAALRAQGVLVGTELVARKAIRAGQVVVDGEACTDPDRLVDPDALG